MACNIQMISLPCVGKVVLDLERVTLNTNLKLRSRSCTKKLSIVAKEKTPTTGKFGTFGGKFVPELLIAPLEKLEAEFNSILEDHEFKVKPVDGKFQSAVSESIRSWIENLESSYYLACTAVGPHPIPTMIGKFYSVIGKETRKQVMDKWGGMPDVLLACVGTGCNALGLFHEFIGDASVRMIGIKGGGVGTNTNDLHSSTLVRGEVGVFHGAMCYLLEDGDGQIIRTKSIASGLEFPGVSPELSFLKHVGRLECYTVTDQEALDAYKRLCHLEGIFPALEASHALAYLGRLCPTLPQGAKRGIMMLAKSSTCDISGS